MKKIAAIVVRFIVIFLGATLIISTVLLAKTSLQIKGIPTLDSLIRIPFMAAPAAIVSAAFVTFFLLNRLITSRLAGYPLLIAIIGAATGGVATAIRFLGIRFNEAAQFSFYASIYEWLGLLARSAWLEFGVGIGAFSFFVSSFWGITRLAKTRPLIGAFLAPSGIIASLYLLSIYQSRPAHAIFSLVGLEISGIMASAFIAGASALALLLADALFAAKPKGGSHDA